MLVIENPSTHVNAGERAFIAHQRGKQGIALINFRVGGNRARKPGREIDAILILPRGIFAVEVKATSAVGELDASANDTWRVGDIDLPFPSSRTPSAQADLGAKILAGQLASPDWPRTYVVPVVSIVGKVTVPNRVAWVGTVGVSTVEHFDLVAKRGKSRRIQARHVGPMLRRLGVADDRVPSIERLLAEGFAEDTQTEPVVTEEPEPVVAPDEPDVVEAEAPAPGPSLRPLIYTTLVVLLGVWQLSTGQLFTHIANPQPGDEYFLYRTWDAAVSAPFAVPIVGAILVVLFGVAHWLRLHIGSMTRTEHAAFWVSTFALIVMSPIWFVDLQWAGVWVAWLLYTAVWPAAAIVVIAARRSTFGDQLEQAWREYEI